jgi:hypothetical protein
MTQAVLVDQHGVVHYRLWEPKTCCGEWGLYMKTVQLGDGLPLSPLRVLPAVTCLLCLTAAEDND